MAHPFVHVELSTTDVVKTKSFYGKLFDWHCHSNTLAWYGRAV